MTPMSLRIFNSSHVINKQRSPRLVIGFLSYAASATNKIVEKGKRAVVTGMSLMLCILGRTHCILNRHCFVFRACAQLRPHNTIIFHVGCPSKQLQCEAVRSIRVKCLSCEILQLFSIMSGGMQVANRERAGAGGGRGGEKRGRTWPPPRHESHGPID
ncbi:unnamed protein product [Euphydryas editha]|uniref:Uncharacterized protein n=1 Tax=Euphydryas editha TaxID=104508 RepID=A0AAU9V776_EUPED|nr:unnamed protein product [Euphydryas editha]